MNKEIVKVSDLQDEKWTLVNLSQDVDAVIESCGLPENTTEEYPTLFVEIGDAEYLTVYGINNTVPYLHKDAYLLWESVNGIGKICYDNL